MPFSPKSPLTQTPTFIMVLLFTMIKEAYEDLGRYKQDKEINYKMAEIYDSVYKRFKDIFWYQFKTGDIIKVKKRHINFHKKIN